MGAICGMLGPAAVDALPGMPQAMRRRGALLYGSRLGACGLRQLGPGLRAWNGDVERAGRRFAVAFEGDIFNLSELRRGEGGSIAEILVELYLAHGEAFPALIDGPFALALTDGARLLLARDRCGVKPLYYSRAGGGLLFASEIKALVRALPAAPQFDIESMREYYVFADHMLGDSTLFTGIKQVRPGFCVTAQQRDGEVQLREHEFVAYGSLASESGVGDPIDDEALASRLFAVLERNVAHFVAQVERPGVLLSGGVDSSVLAALAVKHAGRRVRTYTISDDAQFPDVVAARRVAAHLGTRHREFIVSADTEHSGWVEGIHAYEDLIYRNTIFLLAKQVAGTADLVLSGAGADFLSVPVLRRGARFDQVNERWRALQATAGPGATAPGSLLSARMASLRENEVHAIQTHFATEYIPNELFPSTERAMQYFGIEVGFPFASNLVHALSWCLPYRYRQHDGVEKPLLRKALAAVDLPVDIKLRPKLCTKENLASSKRNLIRSTLGADRAALERAVPDEIKPLVRSKYQAVKLALLRRIFMEERGELPADFGQVAAASQASRALPDPGAR